MSNNTSIKYRIYSSNEPDSIVLKGGNIYYAFQKMSPNNSDKIKNKLNSSLMDEIQIYKNSQLEPIKKSRLFSPEISFNIKDKKIPFCKTKNSNSSKCNKNESTTLTLLSRKLNLSSNALTYMYARILFEKLVNKTGFPMISDDDYNNKIKQIKEELDKQDPKIIEELRGKNGVNLVLKALKRIKNNKGNIEMKRGGGDELEAFFKFIWIVIKISFLILYIVLRTCFAPFILITHAVAGCMYFAAVSASIVVCVIGFISGWGIAVCVPAIILLVITLVKYVKDKNKENEQLAIKEPLTGGERSTLDVLASSTSELIDTYVSYKKFKYFEIGNIRKRHANNNSNIKNIPTQLRGILGNESNYKVDSPEQGFRYFAAVEFESSWGMTYVRIPYIVRVSLETIKKINEQNSKFFIKLLASINVSEKIAKDIENNPQSITNSLNDGIKFINAPEDEAGKAAKTVV